jgi:hypothetical protein
VKARIQYRRSAWLMETFIPQISGFVDPEWDENANDNEPTSEGLDHLHATGRPELQPSL